MGLVEKTALHEAFRVSTFGDAFIVAPHGDGTSFPHHILVAEMETIASSLRKMPGCKVILDLAASNYFGTQIIAELAKLSAAVKFAGGRIAVCNMSSAMEDALHRTNLDDSWTEYDTLSEATGALVKLSVKDRLWLWRVPLVVAAVVLLAITVPFFLPKSRLDDRQYAVLSEIWIEADQLRAKGATETEWMSLAKKARKRGQAAADELTSSGSLDPRPAGKALLPVARDHLVRAVEAHMQEGSIDTQSGWILLQIAEENLVDPPKISIRDRCPVAFAPNGSAYRKVAATIEPPESKELPGTAKETPPGEKDTTPVDAQKDLPPVQPTSPDTPG